MKLKGKIFLAAALLGATVILLAAGCGNPLHVTADRSKTDSGDATIASRAVITDGTSFTATKNPFIYTSIGRNSSDPSAISVDVNGVQTILLVASSDLKNQNTNPPLDKEGKIKNVYPMDQTYLYAMSANGGNMTQWRDFGAILSEGEIDWAEEYDHLWAPDIQKVVTDGYGGRATNYFAFVPAFDKELNNVGGGQRIAVATRHNDPFGKFDYIDSFHLTGTDDFDNTPYYGVDGTMYDPGVFSLNEIHTTDTSTKGYMAFCSYYCPEGRIFMSTIPNMGVPTSGDYNGEIRFNYLPDTDGDLIPNVDEHGHSTFYMEGPDIVRVPNNYGGPDLLYLMFAAKIGNDQEYIGYATMTPEEFQASPAGPWDFQGWVMKQTDPAVTNGSDVEWTNQGSLVVQPDPARPGKSKYYLFYHYSEGDNGSNGQMRQIAMREITVGNDGLIQGVCHPSITGGISTYSNSLGHQEYPNGNSSVSAAVSEDLINDPYSVQPQIFINNRTNVDLGNFTVHYYFTTESVGRAGRKIPVLDGIYGAGSNVSLKQISYDVWAVVMEKTGLAAGASWPEAGSGITFRLSYSDGSVWDKTNDFSNPRGNSFTDTDRIAVYNEKGQLVMGTAPQYKIICKYAGNANNGYSTRALTCAEASSGVAAAWGEIYDPSMESQRWSIEPIYGSSYVRLKSCFTWLYLNYLNDSTALYNCSAWADSKQQKFNLSLINPKYLSTANVINYSNTGTKRLVTYNNPVGGTGGNNKGRITNKAINNAEDYTMQQWSLIELK